MTRPVLRRRNAPGPAQRGALSAPWLVGMGLAWLAITAGILLFVLPIIAEQTRNEVALKARGLASTAQALRMWTTPGGRAGPAHHLAFAFTPAAGPARVDEAYITAREARAIRVPSSVPVIYLPDDPSVAALNLDDAVHRRHPQLVGIAATAFMLALLVAMWGALAMFTTEALRERRSARGKA